MKLRVPEINALTLRVLAMACMLLDHMWATVVPGNMWMTCVGRLAFPIFAFFAVEGYFHTRDLRKYLLRLLVFALISEIPFNLMTGGGVFYPFHQNVLWTFLLALGCVWIIERVRARGSWYLTVPAAAAVAGLGYLAGLLTMVDYGGCGVLMVLVFYVLLGSRWRQRLGQLLGLAWINGVLLAGLTLPVQLFGRTFEFPQQMLAVLALVPIWMYRGRQGPHNRVIQLACYAFYPVHILILAVLWLYV